ncbi:unnamed protein product [Linum tenue]|uniref:Uncharacterized protein n=1 Tax=Linum tenue TaxID=586396 RepID=A0AAV0NKF6_9ROSI|nr:unnamed protein product [Linum tenue]
MGRKLDAILGRNNFKSYKFKALANLAVSRLAIFKNQRQVKLNHAHSDVVDLLRLRHHDRALLRVEHVIKEQGMLEVYAMMEGYCNLLVERLHLIEQQRVCPDELKEAISSLLFASSRCGDFPELQEIRLLFTSRYGKEFAARAVELRNNCGVSYRMIQKMSTRQPDRETRIKVLREIAAENNIVLEELDQPPLTSQAEPYAVSSKQGEEGETLAAAAAAGANNASSIAAEEIGRDGLADSIPVNGKYKDVAGAAQAAFESAVYAAEAARAAVELSRSDDRGHPDNHDKRREVMMSQDEEMKDSEPEPEDEETVYYVESTAAASESKSSSSSLDPENLARRLDKKIQFDDESDDEEETEERIMNADDPDKVEGHEAPPRAKSSENIIPSVIQAGLKVESVDVYPNAQQPASRESRTTRALNILKAPFSVRTRNVRGY